MAAAEAGKFDLVKEVYQRVINNSLLAANKKLKKAESEDDDESSGNDDLDDSDVKRRWACLLNLETMDTVPRGGRRM